MSFISKVNQDQVNFSTPLDNWKFHYMRGKGHFFRYLLNRYRWHHSARTNTVHPYPEHVDLELSSRCNMRCPMCYTQTDRFKKQVKTGFMERDFWKKIIDDCADNGVFSLRLSLRGEPTIHPDFVEAARYAKERGICEVSSLTNALSMTPDMFEELVLMGFDWLTISADGLGETYESIRKPAKFDEFMEKIRHFSAIKKKHRSMKPAVKVQTVWPAIMDDPQEYYETFRPYVDLVACNPLMDYLFKDGEQNKITYIENFQCSVPWQRLTIGSDGGVLLCFNDEFADYSICNMADHSLREVWTGDVMTSFRECHLRHNAVNEYSSCKNCYMPREETDDSEVSIDGRTVKLTKLKGRTNEVGK
ncbi:MAG: radical SAM/SPASM domain-containing protein [Desulfovibrio sp.]|uniref:radical SAM/SPASM domain-containing protein n=1 Tax=Desulfovibrio sp. 7SRBS1 TaxID=3378064 RepID=UPI003B40C499